LLPPLTPFCSSSQIQQRESGLLLLTDPEEEESERAGTKGGRDREARESGGGRNRSRFWSVRWEQVGFHPGFHVSQPSKVNPTVKNETCPDVGYHGQNQ